MADIATIRAAAAAPATTPLVARLQGFIAELLVMVERPLYIADEQGVRLFGDPTPEQVTAFIDRLHGATGYRFPVNDEAVFRHGVREGLIAAAEARRA